MVSQGPWASNALHTLGFAAWVTVIAIAGLVFGREAAQNAIMNELSGLMGQ
jgi:hypothetical protein